MRLRSDGDSGPTASVSTAQYWSWPIAQLLERLGSDAGGLGSARASERLAQYGRNALVEHRLSSLGVLGNQLKSPLVLLLLFAAIASGATGAWVDAAIVIVIVGASVALGFSREYAAATAAAALRASVQTRVRVLRDGQEQRAPVDEIVPGDVVLLSAGSLVPADCVLLEAVDLHLSEAALTGESFPILKDCEPSAPHLPLGQRRNCVFMGTNVRSGSGRCVVVTTGTKTQFGAIAARLSLRPPDTEFDRGMARFGYLLTSAMALMAVLVFLVHVARGRSAIETVLFAVALAVGLSPELLPAILSVNLAGGARRMAAQGVLVRHLKAIENLGSMDILCTDKTGTLTEGAVRLEGAYDPSGVRSDAVLALAAQNAALETGLSNPLDDAILDAAGKEQRLPAKLAEIPFDFTRKRVTVVVQRDDDALLVTKGAYHRVLEACSRSSDGASLDEAARERLDRLYDAWSAQGTRVLAVAERQVRTKPSYGREDERDLSFMGFLTFSDRPKAGVREALCELAELGVTVKVITGDSKRVAEHVAGLVGLRAERILTGAELDKLSGDALCHAAERTDLFVEVDPNQKERVILALKKLGHVVGFLGDGVNDAPAMHAADTSLSVDDAVDVAREAADFVLLDRHLDVIRRGIVEGRKTFANTLKYVLMTMSANLGNMISMAIASLWLPFLPLLAGQILLNNFLSDIPALGLAADGVDAELVSRPRRWNMRFIGRFMLEFGLLSSVFDFMAFGALLTLHASPELFRSGWFVESLLTEIVVALLIRTRRPFYESRPGTFLMVSTLIVAAVGVAVPFLPGAAALGFRPLPLLSVTVLLAITAAYATAVELYKAGFYRRIEAGQKDPARLSSLPTPSATG
jgi:P-type Mg2+ transporter